MPYFTANKSITFNGLEPDKFASWMSAKYETMVLRVFFFFIASNSLVARAQEAYVNFDYLDNRRGLGNNIVYDLAQDSKGGVWVATHNGLQRFDGTKFISAKYGLSGGTLPKTIYKILVSKNETSLWLVSAEGFFRYNYVLKRIEQIKGDSISATNVSSFLEDSTGTVWICSRNDLYFLDPNSKELISYKEKWPAAEAQIKSLRYLTDKKQFLLNTSRGLLRFDPGKQIYSAVEIRMTSNNVLQTDNLELLNDNTGIDFWCQSKSGLRWQLTNLESAGEVKFSIPLPDNASVTSIHLTRRNNVIAIGSSLRVYHMQDKRWAALTESILESFHTRKVLCLMEDRDGLLWLGTDNGIQVLKPNEFSFQYSSQLKWSQQLLPGLVTVGDSLMLIAEGKEKPVFKMMNTHFRERDYPAINLLNKITPAATAICAERNGKIWAVAEGKILNFDLIKSKLEVDVLRELIGKKIRHILCGRDGNKWLISDQLEFFKMKEAQIVTSTMEKSETLKRAKSYALLDEDFNAIWITAQNYLIRYDNESNQTKHFAFPSGVNMLEVKLWEGDSLLIAANRGLYVVSKKSPDQLRIFKTSRGPFMEDVSALEVDRFGNIWVAAPGNGIYCITASGRLVKRYSAQDGVSFRAADCAFTARLGDEKILLKTADGLIAFSPNQINSPLNPRVNLTSLFLNNQLLNIDSASTRKISLKWWQNSVGFEFSSPSYALRNSIQYSYQLEGADGSWLTAIGDSKITYASLKPGTYKFKVRANTPHQEVISDEASFSFTITAPFWDTIYFKIGVTLILLLTIYLFYRVRINRFILEAKIKTKISRDLHDNIGSSLSSIGLMLNVAISKLENSDVKTLLNKIAYNAHITQENLDDIVWNISFEKRTLSDIVERMHEFIYGIFEHQPVDLDFNVADNVKGLVIRADRRYDLYLIFKELINNAAKYAHANNITVELGLEKNNVKFRYQDDGVGFEPEKQTDGNGLSNIKSRSKSLRGTLIFQSAPGNGTSFLLEFPVK